MCNLCLEGARQPESEKGMIGLAGGKGDSIYGRLPMWVCCRMAGDDDLSGMMVETGMGNGGYLVEGRFIDLKGIGRRLAEIRVRFLDSDGNKLGWE